MAKETQVSVKVSKFKVQALYSKLYHKYSKLKKEKDSILEKLNEEQETKFLSYVKASDEMIDFLKSENDRLSNQVSELRRDMSMIRSTKDQECIQYQTLLMEENQKNKELAEEIETLKHLQRKGLCCQAKGNKVNDELVDMAGSSQAKSVSVEVSKKTRKRRRPSLREGGTTIMPQDAEEVELVQLNVSSDRFSKNTAGFDSPLKYNYPICSKRKKINPDSALTDGGPVNCYFQDLVECIVGLKFSCVVQNEDFEVSVLHPSSGYSFTLTWVNNSHGEPELLYRVLSLGTFERVAPEWMRDVLMFGTSMCPVFFHRMSRVIKLNH